jgi:hypothetical protein
MKPVLTIALVFLLVTGTRCKTITTVTNNPQDDVTTILVECNNLPSTRTNVKLLLQQVRVTEWGGRKLGATEEIEAKYTLIDPREAEYIRDLLTHIAGVIRVEIKKNGLPVQHVR